MKGHFDIATIKANWTPAATAGQEFGLRIFGKLGPPGEANENRIFGARVFHAGCSTVDAKTHLTGSSLHQNTARFVYDGFTSRR